MKRSLTILVASFLSFGQSVPALAYQAHNWPGMATNMDASVAAPEAETTLTIRDTSLPLTRAQFTKQLIDTLYTDADMEGCFGRIVYKDHPGYTLLFWDVKKNHEAAREICMGMHLGLVNGYIDGNFRPDQAITFAEAAKMISKIYAFTPHPFPREKIWYRPYIAELATRNAIPLSVNDPADGLTKAELRVMLSMLGSNKPDHISKVIFDKRAEKPVHAR